MMSSDMRSVPDPKIAQNTIAIGSGMLKNVSLFTGATLTAPQLTE